MNKAELRKIYLQKRINLRQEEVRISSLNLLSQMKETTIFQKKIFHIFLPIKQKKEIFTWFIINFLWLKGKTVVVSKSNFEDKTMKHFILEKETPLPLRENKYGIPEPISAQSINPNQIEVVFVPMLISDEQNNRVGYGKGFYDRFLMKCSEDVLSIGLNFFMPIKRITDINSLDVPLQKVFTSSLK